MVIRLRRRVCQLVATSDFYSPQASQLTNDGMGVGPHTVGPHTVIVRPLVTASVDIPNSCI
jgi:hypothetical protein